MGSFVSYGLFLCHTFIIRGGKKRAKLKDYGIYMNPEHHKNIISTFNLDRRSSVCQHLSTKSRTNVSSNVIAFGVKRNKTNKLRKIIKICLTTRQINKMKLLKMSVF